MPDPLPSSFRPSVDSEKRPKQFRFSRLAIRFLTLGLLASGAAWVAAPAQGQTGSARAEESRGTDPEAPRAPTNLILVFFGLLLASAATAGAETAIFSLNKLDLVHARGRPSQTTRSILYLLDHPNDTLTTLLVVNNGVNIALSLTAGALSETLLGAEAVGGYAIAGFGTAAFLIVFGEVIPKTISHLRARSVANIVAPPTVALAILFLPLRYVINRFIKWVFIRLKVPETRMTELVSEEELKAMIGAREVSTLLEADEREMIHGVFDLRHTFAEEIMVPRTEVTAYPDTLTQQEMLARLRETNHARVLIYRETLDHLVGYLLAKQVLLEPEKDWRKSIREAPLVPMRVRLVDLLPMFRRHSTKIAVLVDEYGGVAGIVTLHDLLEEIVGDITELHEPTEQECQRTGPGRWRVRGRMNLEDLGKQLDVKFPDNMGNTIAGFVMNMLGRVPSPGAELQHDGLNLKVLRMAGRRVTLLEITKEPEAAVVGAAATAEEKT